MLKDSNELKHISSVNTKSEFISYSYYSLVILTLIPKSFLLYIGLLSNFLWK